MTKKSRTKIQKHFGKYKKKPQRIFQKKMYGTNHEFCFKKSTKIRKVFENVQKNNVQKNIRKKKYKKKLT